MECGCGYRPGAGFDPAPADCGVDWVLPDAVWFSVFDWPLVAPDGAVEFDWPVFVTGGVVEPAVWSLGLVVPPVGSEVPVAFGPAGVVAAPCVAGAVLD